MTFSPLQEKLVDPMTNTRGSHVGCKRKRERGLRENVTEVWICGLPRWYKWRVDGYTLFQPEQKNNMCLMGRTLVIRSKRIFLPLPLPQTEHYGYRVLFFGSGKTDGEGTERNYRKTPSATSVRRRRPSHESRSQSFRPRTFFEPSKLLGHLQSMGVRKAVHIQCWLAFGGCGVEVSAIRHEGPSV